MPIFAVSLALAFAGSSSIKWQPGLPQATEIAAHTHKLIMADFYTDWCGWCKKLDADTYAAPEIVSRSQNFVPVKVNAEKEGVAAAKKYGVTGYPTILFLNAEGKREWQVVGYMPPADFAHQMDLAQSVSTQLPKLESTLAAHPHDGVAAAKLIPFYAGLGDNAKLAKVAPVVDRFGSRDTADGADGFNALGDYFQGANKYDQAVAEFSKAINDKFPKQTAYARISVAQCYASLGQPKKAIPVLQAYLAMGHEADTYRAQAQQMLSAMQKGD